MIPAESLPADKGALTPLSPGAAGELPNHPLLAPNAERLGRWYGERLGHTRRWALILEPHRKIAELIGYLLDFELGIQAVSIPRPRLIPNLFRRWTPDLVLAEIPCSDGAPSLGDLENLRPLLDIAQAQSAPIPVILCTTYIEITPALARSAGFAGLVQKPFMPSTLVTTVRGVMEHVLERPR
jgi:CheY-like chemotaxis protein